MKKEITIFIAFLLVSWQQGYAQVLTMSLHGSISNVKLTNYVLDQALIGWNAGIGGGYNLNKHFAIVSELNYESKGVKGELEYYTENGGDEIFSTEENLHLAYVTIPAMLRYTIGHKKIHGFANAGGYYGFLLDAWVNASEEAVSFNATSFHKRSDLGLAFGVGVSYDMNTKYSISLEWRNNYGFKDVSNYAGDQFNRSNLTMLAVYYQLR